MRRSWPAALVGSLTHLLPGCAAPGGPSTTGGEPSASAAAAETPDGCPSFDAGVAQGRVEHGAIRESSGLAASRRQAGVLWVHNDSGDRARLFALGPSGAHLGEYLLEGARAVDWEDMAIGPGPDANHDDLYLGDIGDNLRRRSSVQVYRIAEPTVSSSPGDAGARHRLEGVNRFDLAYPDGSHNAEALLVDPRDGRLYIVSKEEDRTSHLYRAPPLREGSELVLEDLGPVNLPRSALPGSHLVTAGDISPAGDAILLRTYSTAFLYRRRAGASLAEALGEAPCPVPLAIEPQGEAIAFTDGGARYLTTSEHQHQPIWSFAARSAE